MNVLKSELCCSRDKTLDASVAFASLNSNKKLKAYPLEDRILMFFD
jgi:hypothetical protein